MISESNFLSIGGTTAPSEPHTALGSGPLVARQRRASGPTRRPARRHGAIERFRRFVRRSPMSLLRRVLRPFGYDVVRLRKAGVDRPERDQQILEQIRSYTQTGPDRVYALLDALRYVQQLCQHRGGEQHRRDRN